MSGVVEQQQVWSIARLLAWTRDHFQRHAVESPRLCAELLLAHALGCPRIQLYTRFDSVPDAPILATFREHVRRAAAGEPIAYLTGSKEFFSLPFEVTPDVLIPRPETELLVERTLELFRGKQEPSVILDLCTGSGCIAITLARHLPLAKIVATDVSAAALEVARGNAARHAVADRMEFREGDLFSPFAPGEQFDCIVCNPPYVATTESAALPRNVRDFEPHGALFAGADGLDVIRRVISDAPPRLRPGGYLLLEMAYNQAPSVRPLLNDWTGVTAWRDGGGHERVIQACRPALSMQVG